ncbi:isopeptide-forming domain-containing fimbrial protein [Curtobacterium sp. Leaf261]|uniref:isopeptide-forming domain-containing fimbrial protein n=1 Tax=Curtobacterium sp. Leaf261 TaxID=1736311 RepID=UPI0012E1BC6B|nr:isopeptide-forming domain-containing fimbrial protein [Curtobacterium sp. Leaf261]
MTLVAAIAGGLLVATAVAATATPAQAAESTVSLAATATASVLAGQPTTVTLTATNPSTTNEYNAGFQYTLPAGATYTAPTTPSSAGEPTISTITDGNGTHQVLVWANVSDLVAGDTSAISFGVTADPAVFPVGSNITGSAAVYTSEDARTLPVFDPTTGLATGGFDDSATKAVDPTKVTALTIEKSEPSPEHELMRGVHDHPTVYKLVVTNTAIAATNTVTVTDYLPAQLEFLECGGIDHTTGQAPEYAGSGSLTATTADTHGNCVTPQSVTTVTNPPGYDAGVYTKVVWALGDLAANGTRTIEYVAGIPQRANAAWPTGEPGGDTEAANLDNNTGASTRQIGGGQTLVNHAVAAGDYAGPVATGTSTTVTAEDSTEVLATDLSIIKSVTTNPAGDGGAPAFTIGGTATYSLRLRASEYESDSAMTITDVLDNGLCPAYPSSITVSGDPVPADCAHTPGSALDEQAVNATITAVAYDASTGKFTLTMTPTLGGSASATMGRSYDSAASKTNITYTALMRGAYTGAGNSGPTSSGDSFANTVDVAGTSTPVNDTDTVTRSVTNGSGTSISTAPTQISKQVLSRTAGPISSAADCTTAPQGLYSSSTDTANPFQLGDDVCFRLEVDFPTGIDTRNPSVTDYVPVGTTFVDAALPADSTFDASTFVRAGNVSDTTRATWNLGTTQGTNGRYVDGGTKLVFYVLANITKQGTSQTTPDLGANLMKFRQENTAGKVSSLRTSVGYEVAAAPVVTLDKAITAVGPNPGALTPVSPQPQYTAEGQALQYQLTVRNTGTAAAGTARDVDAVTVWDALPLGITCADVPAAHISDGGVCTTAPTGAAFPSRSYVRWTPSADGTTDPLGTIAASGTKTLTYVVVPPAGTSVSTQLVNQASVTSFATPNNTGASTTYVPAVIAGTSSSATGPTGSQGTAPAANARTTIALPDATVTKTGAADNSTTVTNVSGNTAVPGEALSYTYTANVPAHTSVVAGSLVDTLPTDVTATTGVRYVVSVPGTPPATITAPTGDTAVGGFTLHADGTLDFPANYDNTTDAAQAVSVTVSGLIVTPTSGVGTIRNTATFTSTVAGSTKTISAPKDITVVVPVPRVTKTASSTTVGAGRTVDFVITARNDSTTANAYDAIVVDCLPNALSFGATQTTPLPTGVTEVAAPATPTCATGTTAHAYAVGTIAPGGSVAFTRTATLSNGAAGSSSYTNTARLVTSSLSDGGRNTATEGVETSAASNAAVTVAGPSLTKQISVNGGALANSASNVRVGETTASYTITATIPADVNLYAASIVDTLPGGMTATGAPTCTIDGTPQACDELQTGSPATKVLFRLGDVIKADAARTVVVTLPVRFPTGTTTATNYDNTAKLGWNDATGTQPTNPDAAFTHTQASNAVRARTAPPVLGATKTVTNPAPKPGDVFTYTVTVTNSGQNPAYGATPTDTVPTGVVVDPATITGGGTLTGADAANGGGTITWPTADVNAGTPLTYTYAAKLAPSASLTPRALLTNRVATGPYTSMPGAGASYPSVAASSSVTPAFPIVAIAKSGATGPAYIGAPYTWTVTFTNTGAAATNVAATDTLPANWTFDTGSAKVSVNGGTATTVAADSATGTPQAIAWNTLGALPANGTMTLTYTATPRAGVTTTPGVGSTVSHTNTVHAVVTDAAGGTRTAAGNYAGPDATAAAHIDAADLAITKRAAATAPIAGAGPAAGWTIVVENTGTTDTSVGPFHVRDTPDTLPAGVTVTGATGTGWTCALASGVVTCDTASSVTLAPGASLPPITVRVALDQSVPAGTVVGNTASIVDQHTADTNPGNDSSHADVTTAARADLAIAKTGPTTANTGDTVTYTIAVTNAGPSTAAGPVAVDDQVPAGIRVTGVDGGADWTCDPATNTVHCTLPDGLAANGSVSAITVTGVVRSATTGTVTNTATVSSPTPDPTPGNNTSGTVSTSIGSATTLSVDKVLTSFTPGTTGTYAVTVTNTGTADARSVTLADPLPNGLTYASVASDDGWTCSADATAVDVSCTLAGTLTAGESATLTLTVDVPAGIRDDVVNTATASADNAPDASGSATTSTTPLTELTIDKTDDAPADLAAGQGLDYTIAVGNRGPSDIVTGDTTVVTDELPVGETFVSAEGTGWTVVQDGRSLTFTSTSGVRVGGAFPAITISVVVDADRVAGPIVNEATVTSSAAAHSASDTDSVDVATRAALTIDKVLAPGSSTVAGTDATFTVTVANTGPSDARTVSLTDLAPAGMTITKVAQTSGPAWTCAAASCTVDQLASGDAGTSVFTVTGSIAASVRASTLTNTATVTWGDSDRSRSAEDTADVDVIDRAALTMTKTAVGADGKPVSSVAAGNQVAWRLQIHNAGPSDADGPVTVADHLPTGMTYVGLADSMLDGANQGWTCTVDATDPQVVTCTTQDGVLADTDAAPLVIATSIDPAEAAGTTTNTATVSSPTPAPFGTDGGAEGSVTVAPDANVAITITHSGDGVIGQPIPATATVVNTGPSTATDVTATITLPAGLTFRDTDGTDPAWTAGSPVVNADGTTTIVFSLAGPLAPGQTAPPIVVTSVVTPGSYPTATIGATTATATPETTTADNTSDTAITIGALSSLSVTKTHTQALVRNHTVGYTITVTNAGPTSDPGPVTVTDALPDGLTFVSIDTRDAATCTTGTTVVCTLDAPLAVDASVALQLTVKVAGNAPDRITNRAVVATPTVQVGQAGDGAGDGGSDGGPVGSDPLRASDPATVAADPAALAFTGSGSVLALALFALLAVAGGTGLVVLRRRRPAGGAPRR